VTSYRDVAPLAMMSDSVELMRAWVIEALGSLADDDDHIARLRDPADEEPDRLRMSAAVSVGP